MKCAKAGELQENLNNLSRSYMELLNSSTPWKASASKAELAKMKQDLKDKIRITSALVTNHKRGCTVCNPSLHNWHNPDFGKLGDGAEGLLDALAIGK